MRLSSLRSAGSHQGSRGLLMDSGATHLARQRKSGEDGIWVEVELAGGNMEYMMMSDAGTLLVETLDQPIFPVIEFCRLTGATQETDGKGVMRLKHSSVGTIEMEMEGSLPVVKNLELQEKLITMFEAARSKEMVEHGLTTLKKLSTVDEHLLGHVVTELEKEPMVKIQLRAFLGMMRARLDSGSDDFSAAWNWLGCYFIVRTGYTFDYSVKYIR